MAVAGLVLAGCAGAGPQTRTDAAVTTPVAATHGGPTGADAMMSARPDGTPAGAEPSATAQALLGRYATALAQRDRAAYVRTLADPDSAFGRQRLAAFGTFGSLPVTGLRWSTVTVTGDVVRAVGSYTLAGYDAGPHTFALAYRMSAVDGTWRLAGVADGNRPQLWDLPDAQVLRSRRVLVVGSLPRGQLLEVQRRAERAVDAVGRVWTAPWRQRLVVVAPASTQAAADFLGETPASLDGVAAVTDGPLPVGRSAPSDRVVLDPTGNAALTATGRQVVLTHEATHVAVRATTIAPVPLWLSEGLAEVTAYDGVDLPEATVAAGAVAQVRVAGLPAALPPDSAFDIGGAALAPLYQQSWLAVRRLLAVLGPRTLTATYQAAADPTTGPDPQTRLGRALSATTPAMTIAQLTRQWRAELGRLAQP